MPHFTRALKKAQLLKEFETIIQTNVGEMILENMDCKDVRNVCITNKTMCPNLKNSKKKQYVISCILHGMQNCIMETFKILYVRNNLRYLQNDETSELSNYQKLSSWAHNWQPNVASYRLKVLENEHVIRLTLYVTKNTWVSSEDIHFKKVYPFMEQLAEYISIFFSLGNISPPDLELQHSTLVCDIDISIRDSTPDFAQLPCCIEHNNEYFLLPVKNGYLNTWITTHYPI